MAVRIDREVSAAERLEEIDACRQRVVATPHGKDPAERQSQSEQIAVLDARSTEALRELRGSVRG